MCAWQNRIVSVIVALALWFLAGSVPANPSATTATLRLESLRKIRSGHNSGITGLRFSPDSKFLVTSGAGSIRVWDVRTGRNIRRIRMPRGEASTVEAIAVSRDGKMIVANGFINKDAFFAPAGDMETRFYCLRTGKEMEHLRLTNWASQITPVELSPDGTFLVAAAPWHSDETLLAAGKPAEYDQIVHLYNLQTNASEVLKPLADSAGTVRSFHFSSDSRYLTICQESLIEKADLLTQSPVFSLQLPEKQGGMCHEVSLCGRFLASLAWHGQVFIRSLPGGKLIQQIKNLGYIHAIRFCPSSKHLFLAAEENPASIYVLDMASGAVTHSIPSLENPKVMDVAPDELTLAVADFSGMIHLLKIAKESKGNTRLP